MALQIGAISQKGGGGKSSIARLIAREYAVAGWDVKIADLDIAQATSTNWKQRREQNGIQPEIAVEPFRTVTQALKHASVYDLVVFDGKPHSNRETLEIAQACNLVVLPTGLSLDDGVVQRTPQKDIVHFKMCESYVKKVLIFVSDSSKCCIVEKRYIKHSSVSQGLRLCEKSYLRHELRHIDRNVSKGVVF